MKLYKRHNREISHQPSGNRSLPKSLQFTRQDLRLTSRPLRLIQHTRSIESKERSENKLSIKRSRMSTSNAVRLPEWVRESERELFLLTELKLSLTSTLQVISLGSEPLLKIWGEKRKPWILALMPSKVIMKHKYTIKRVSLEVFNKNLSYSRPKTLINPMSHLRSPNRLWLLDKRFLQEISQSFNTTLKSDPFLQATNSWSEKRKISATVLESNTNFAKSINKQFWRVVHNYLKWSMSAMPRVVESKSLKVRDHISLKGPTNFKRALI